MSLINKMLQDLDARGSQGGDFIDMDVKSVVSERPRFSTPMIAAVLAGAIALAVAGLLGWRYFKKPPVVQAPVTIVNVPAAPVAVPAPLPVAVPVATPAAAPTVSVAPPAAPSPRVATGPAPMAKPVALVEQAAPPAVEPRRRTEAPAPRAVRVVRAPVVAAPVVQGRQPSTHKTAQGAYSAALGQLQEGRVNEAMANLEQAVRLDPRHEAARQTLVGLLIEDERPDEAMAQLQAGLALDVRQPSLAMLLARMQIERGSSGVDTLMRSLPAGTGNGDYHALLAGALQREQRHAEAADQYLAALRTAPQNGVWLMGLGISLQGAKRDAEALEAFQRAKASGNLTAQLTAFVDRKLQQLAK